MKVSYFFFPTLNSDNFNLVGRKFTLALGIKKLLSLEQQISLIEHYHETHRSIAIHLRSNTVARNPNFIHNYATSHKYLVLDGRRIIPSSSKTHAPNSIIQVTYGDRKFVGQVLDILTHRQPNIEEVTLLEVRWFRSLENLSMNYWDL
jgi:hypothetical protein